MSELKTSKVKNIQSLGNKGAYYVWEVELENGDNAELFKKNNNPWIEIGQEIEYELRAARNPNDRPGINVKKKVGFSSGSDSKNYSYGSDAKDNIINKAWAIKTAALCYAGHWNNDGPTQSPERISEDVLALAKLYKISLDEWVKE
jgi:hypothetical protein|tara:strand:+ start:499 stop:936 length:438 start_codon:yes stop_codon:yes gene_type:complete